jgi:hypothetical protein
LRFQVPQFIETENKIVGPFTLKQFIWLAAGGAIIFVFFYTIKNLTLLIVMILPVAALAIALAFAKVDGIPLPRYLYLAVYYLISPKRYTFGKKDDDSTYLPKGLNDFK